MDGEPRDSASGAAYALAAYGIWGITPLYWKALERVPAAELLDYRVLWSCASALVLLAATRRFGLLREVLATRRTALAMLVSGLLIAANWLTFIHAVEIGRVLSTSLGYYINPLVSVLLGLVLLGERLSRAQALAVALAGLGVAWMALRLGELPWISCVLAGSFALYGLVRKLAAAPPLVGFALEMLFLAPLAAGHLAVLGSRGELARAGLGLHALVACAGPITAAPLLCFASAAKRLPLSSLGFFQYVAPSLAFALAVGLFGEHFTRAHAVTFGCVWLALALYSTDLLRQLARPAPRGAGG